MISVKQTSVSSYAELIICYLCQLWEVKFIFEWNKLATSGNGANIKGVLLELGFKNEYKTSLILIKCNVALHFIKC